MNFIAFDFETANAKRTSACSIGISVVENGFITLSRQWFIRPEPFFFSHWNVAVHGIEAYQVENEPDFEDVWPEIEEYFQGNCVAHNLSFDRSVLKRCLEFSGIDFPLGEFYCSVKAARAQWPDMYNHKLNTVADELGIALNHHDACSDANACAEIMLRIAQEKRINSFSDIFIN
jgi:DNA polymerase III subunit epsilon